MRTFANCKIAKRMENIIEFYKYEGTGNDFILIDNRDLSFKKNPETIARLCHRRFGIGADGLMLLENSTGSTTQNGAAPSTDFRMIYFNSDGNEGSMCGNGGRCITAFAQFLGIIESKTFFEAPDGLHEAEVKKGLVKLKMADVENITTLGEDFVLNTGSPHLVKFTDDIENVNVYSEGNKIRYSATYAEEGINVNFVEKLDEDVLFVRTYERGVEGETLSCGTGSTAAALTVLMRSGKEKMLVNTLGGKLLVYAEKSDEGFRNIWLEGPARLVFNGIINL